MSKILRYLIIPSLLLLVIATIFYFDKTLPIGPDVSFYMDLSSLISRGEKFLVDFFDYRIPVLPLLFSPVYKIGLSDFQNRFIMFFGIYSLYCLSLYFISFSLTRSHLKSAVATLLVFVCISSRQFDPARNISVPLFYHTLELISLFLLFRLLIIKPTEISRKKIIFYPLLAGILYGMAFMGRQTQITIPLAIAGFIIYLLYKKGLGGINLRDYLPTLLIFLAGLGISMALVFHAFYIPGINFLSLAKRWLMDIPVIIYRAEPLRIAKKFITSLYWGLPEMRNVKLPIYWTTYVVSTIGFSVFFFSEPINDVRQKIKLFYRQNKKFIFFILLVGFMAVATVFTTGSGANSHESPFFTLYFFILSFFLYKIRFRYYLKNLVPALLLALFFFPNAIDFAKKEIKTHVVDWQNQEIVSFPERIADKLKPLIEPGDTVLILGSYPTITRLADYKPFMGNINDTFLYSGQKFFSDKYQENLIKNLDKINVAYKLPDYPGLVNLSGIRENASNEIYLYIENYLKLKFEVASIIKKGGMDEMETKNSYGNYTDRATIYHRVARKK